VPAWSKLVHTCTLKEGDAFLFAVNDKPMVEALGLWRDAAKFIPS
jgi:gentisate 1,2-dioxygenase